MLVQVLDVPAEQVIAVPKISLDRIPLRSAVRRTRKAEHLVEEHTIVPFSSLHQRAVEQIFDFLVPGRGGGGGRGGLQGLRPGHNSTARFVEQNVDIPVPGGGLHDLPDPGGSSSSAVSRDECGEGFFGLFLGSKKVRSQPASLSPRVPAHGLRRLVRGCRPRTSTSSTTAPCGSRLGTTSTSVTVGVKSAVTTAAASCRCIGPHGSSSRVHGLADRVRDGVLLRVLRRLRPCEHAAQVPAVPMTVVVPRLQFIDRVGHCSYATVTGSLCRRLVRSLWAVLRSVHVRVVRKIPCLSLRRRVDRSKEAALAMTV